MTRRLRRLRRKLTPRKAPGYDLAKLSAACDAAMAGLRRTEDMLFVQRLSSEIHRCAVHMGVSFEQVRAAVTLLATRPTLTPPLTRPH